jgi:hypothetical protein
MERGIGDTRRLTVGAAGGCRIRGDPETHRQAMLEERGLGATRSFTQPGSLKDAGLEETRRTIAGKAGRFRNRGDPGNDREALLRRITGETHRSTKAEPKDAEIEETR